MTDVVLIYPPIYFANRIPQILDVSRPPLGVLYLAANLESKHTSVRVLDIGAENLTLDRALSIIENESPSVVGISSMTANLQGTIQIAKEIKNKFEDEILICIGGSHVSADPDFVNRFSNLFDFALIGEGDITFPQIVKKILNKEKIERINYGETPLNLDQIPFPARHFIKRNKYLKETSIITSRGCPYECIFCSRPAIAKKVRFRSAANVVDEMEANYKYCDGNFVFEDDTFTLRRDRIFQLCEEILKRKLDANWSAITRADLVDEHLLRKMHKAGCTEITFGIESGNSRIRNQIIKKNLTDEQIYIAINLCNNIGIKASCFLMMGFPTETKKELYDTVNFSNNLDLHIIGIHLSLPLPGSRLFDVAVREGCIGKDIIDKYAKGEMGQGFREVWPIYVPNTLSIQDMLLARRIAYYKFYFKPKYIYRKFINDLSSWKQLKYDIKTATNLLLFGRSERSPS